MLATSIIVTAPGISAAATSFLRHSPKMWKKDNFDLFYRPRIDEIEAFLRGAAEDPDVAHGWPWSISRSSSGPRTVSWSSSSACVSAAASSWPAIALRLGNSFPPGRTPPPPSARTLASGSFFAVCRRPESSAPVPEIYQA